MTLDLNPAKAPLYGLVLTGGKSSRMGVSKADLVLHDKPQFLHLSNLLDKQCERVFISVSENCDTKSSLPQIPDAEAGVKGPLRGIMSALRAHPEAAFLVVACDLPFVDEEALACLVKQRDPSRLATAFHSPDNQLVEPLIAIYESIILSHLEDSKNAGRFCPRKILANLKVKTVEPQNPQWVTNMNTLEDLQAVKSSLGFKKVEILYFAELRENAGRASEIVDTKSQSLSSLFGELQSRHQFTLQESNLSVALNDELVPFDSALQDGDRVVFIPPVSGG